MALPQSEKIDISLPAILCLHAYGTNVSILRYQLRHITQPLIAIFRFIFVDAPFYVQQPGPGVPLGFKEAGPFRRWHSDKRLAEAFGVSVATQIDERRRVRELLHNILEREKPPGMGIVGIFAFSQGAALGTALCLDPELGADIKFAVMFCALYPALSIAEDDDDDCHFAGRQPVIKIPSIHVQGSSDAWRGQGDRMLKQYFEVVHVRKIEFAGLKHEVPSKPKDVLVVVEEIMGLWKQIATAGQIERAPGCGNELIVDV